MAGDSRTDRVVEILMPALILKRANASRPSGHWSEDDYDVIPEGEVVGRIMKVIAAPESTPWMRTLAYGQPFAYARLPGNARDLTSRSSGTAKELLFRTLVGDALRLLHRLNQRTRTH
jgi:hypothetical protein